MAPTWWEKTVEYAFVAVLYRKELIDFAAPISGRYERSSADGIFGKDNTLLLIEFKRSFEEIPSERSMFKDYTGAQKVLSHYDHHWIVYGRINGNNKFAVRGRKYFDDLAEEEILNIPAKGVSHREFMEYLELLNGFKYPDDRGGGGHVSPESMATVLGISPEGTVVGSATLHEYTLQLFPQPTPSAPYRAASPSFKPPGL